MGKASSSKKINRAARAAGRPGAQKNYAWPIAIGVVVVLGVLGVVLSFSGGASDASPKVGEHWHAAYGIYDCGTFATPFPDDPEDVTGIHTHGEGLMHLHPFTSRVSGEDATVGAFAEETGFEVSDTSVKAELLGIDRSNGDACEGGEAEGEGRLQLVVWDDPADDEPTVITKDIADHAPQDSSVWVLAFVPPDTEVPLPPSVANLQDPRALEEGRQPATATTVPASTDSTVPADTTATTAATTTIPPTDESTSTTAAP